MQQQAPRVLSKQVGLQKVDWIDPKELNVFINVLLTRVDALELLTQRITTLEAAVKLLQTPKP